MILHTVCMCSQSVAILCEYVNEYLHVLLHASVHVGTCGELLDSLCVCAHMSVIVCVMCMFIQEYGVMCSIQ